MNCCGVLKSLWVVFKPIYLHKKSATHSGLSFNYCFACCCFVCLSRMFEHNDTSSDLKPCHALKNFFALCHFYASGLHQAVSFIKDIDFKRFGAFAITSNLLHIPELCFSLPI